MSAYDAYNVTVFVIGLTGILFLTQLLIVDVVALKRKHKPGFPIDADYDDFLFRANRAFLNSNETVGVFILLTVFALFSAADANALNTAALVYFLARLFHMLFYYFNLKVMRSIAFTVSLVALLAIFVVGYIAW